MKNLGRTFVVALATAAGMFALGAAGESRSRARKIDEQTRATSDRAVSGAQPVVSLDVEPAHVANRAPAIAAAEAQRETSKEEDRETRPRQADPEQLRTMVAPLEQQMERARSELELLRRLNEQLEAMRREMAERDGRRAAHSAAAEEMTVQRAAAEAAAAEEAIARKREAV